MKYIFLHIPKNGGTTLQRILDNQYKKYEIYNIPDDQRKERLQKLKEKSNFSKSFIKVIKGGHFSYGCHAFFRSPGKVKYFAMLRDPSERALSYYLYVKNTPVHYLHAQFISENVTFDDFLVRKDLNMEISNGQTKLIAGVEQQEHCSSETFEEAKINLKSSFFLVGIMEKYVETLFILKSMLNWKKPINYKILNVYPSNKSVVTFKQREKLQELNKYDNALYKDYRSIFDQELEKYKVSDFETFKKTLIH